MSLNLNPWLALLLGILIGWLLEWLLELWFFRRRRLDCQRQLAQTEADLAAKEADLANARAHAESLQADLTARSVERAASERGVVIERVPAIERLAEPERVPAVESGVGAEPLPAAPSPAPPEAPPSSPEFPVLWPEVSRTVAETGRELPAKTPLAAEFAAPSIGAELPAGVTAGVAHVGLPVAAIAATAVPDKAAAAPQQTPAAATSCPQPLSKIRGIGPVYEQKLYAAGIGAFWQLAQADEADLARILDVEDFQKVSLAEIKAAAQTMAEETDTVGRTWDGSQPDDFEPLGGIGKVYEGRLYDAGICTYAALANATVEQLAEICKAPAWRTPNFASWIAQAKVWLAEGK